MQKNNAVIIVGGGLAGLTAAIHLTKIGLAVILFEKNTFPKHKVCGEYVSNEVLPYLEWLDIDILTLQPTALEKLELATSDGKTINCNLPLGGFGISRYALDFCLYQKALANGCTIIQDRIKDIDFKANQFTVTTANDTVFQSEIVIGAYGKYSNLDQHLNRKFSLKKSSYLAVKAHYSGFFPDNLVGLYNFKGGYCGVSKVENDLINICYLTDSITFKKYKNIDEFQSHVVTKNLLLKEIFDKSKMVFEKPLTISQIFFDEKEIVENHVLMIGDSAGLIHPLCGNGMAMAIHNAKIVSELVASYYSKRIKSRTELENVYKAEWNLNFKKRLKTGRILSRLLKQEKLSTLLMRILIIFPSVLLKIIKLTHGKSITVK